jgi:hypothetical protein
MDHCTANPIQMFIKLGSAMIHGTPSVKPYTDVYQAGQCNDPMEFVGVPCDHCTAQLDKHLYRV